MQKRSRRDRKKRQAEEEARLRTLDKRLYAEAREYLRTKDGHDEQERLFWQRVSECSTREERERLLWQRMNESSPERQKLFWKRMNESAALARGAPPWMQAGINLSETHFETFRPAEKKAE